MILRSSLLRAARLLALFIQLALPSLGMIADASHGEDLLSSRVHVESEGYDCSERGHSADCAVCHFLRTPVLAATRVQQALSDPDRGMASPAAGAVIGTRERLTSLPRAPPLHS